MPSECKVTVTSVNTNTANCEPEFFERYNTKCKNLVGCFLLRILQLATVYEVTSLLRGIVRNPKMTISWVSSQDFLVVGGEEKITVYFDNMVQASLWIIIGSNKLVESGGWKYGLTLGTIVESHFLKTTITKEVKTQPKG